MGGRWVGRPHMVIVMRHARVFRSGQPMQCTPSRVERAGGPRRERPGTDYKIMYPSQEAADAAAAELTELGGEAMRSYRCDRSRPGRPGHYHLTRDRLSGGRGAGPGDGSSSSSSTSPTSARTAGDQVGATT